MKSIRKQPPLTLRQRKKIRALEKELGVELLVSPAYQPARISAKQLELLSALEQELSITLVACAPADTGYAAENVDDHMAPSVASRMIFSWSGGKDSAMALHALMAQSEYQVQTLLTTLTREYERVTMHGVRSVLLDHQAEAMGLPVHKMYIPRDASMEEYEALLREALREHHARQVYHVGFGDIFLTDVKKYREDILTTIGDAGHALFARKGKGGGGGKGGAGGGGRGKKLLGREPSLAGTGMNALFPLWGRNTRTLIEAFVELGFKAIITCVDSKCLDRSFIGTEIDGKFLSQLPSSVDPCGENGEYHSFVYDGPIFRHPIKFQVGESASRGQFEFIDLLPQSRAKVKA
jgi:diphthamide synthase (EF-2-diphthine--ammonia ligase)